MISRRPFSPRFRPLAASSSVTRCASFSVRTNGTMISTLVSPIVSRTDFSAAHSIWKHSAKLSAM